MKSLRYALLLIAIYCVSCVETSNPFPKSMDKRLVGAWVARQRPSLSNSNSYHMVYIYDTNQKGDYEYIVMEDPPRLRPGMSQYYRPVVQGKVWTTTTKQRVYLQFKTPCFSPATTNTFQTLVVDFREDGGVALMEVSSVFIRKEMKAGKLKGQVVENRGLETIQITATAQEQLDWLDSIQGQDEMWFMEVARMRRLGDLKRLPQFRETQRDQIRKQLAVDGYIETEWIGDTGKTRPVVGPDTSWDEIPTPATNQVKEASN